MIKGLISDFNGTLFDDTDLQEAAWDVLLKKYLNRPLRAGEFRDNFHGLTNAEILLYLNRQNPAQPFTIDITDEKEEIYREICYQQPERLSFVKGVPELFDTLQAKQIPFNIATASEITNVRFYFKAFRLERWMSFDQVVYDDQSFPGKPAPDIYLIAAKRLGLKAEECVVCEDSLNGIRAAEAAGAGRIIAHDPQLNAEIIRSDPGVFSIIPDFVGFYEKYMLN